MLPAEETVRGPRRKVWLNNIVIDVHGYPSRDDVKTSKNVLVNCLSRELYSTPSTPGQTTHHT